MRQIFVWAGMFWSMWAMAQNDPLYNQYLFNQAMVNPAYNGINNVFNATVLSRLQWAGIDGAPRTNILSLSSSFLNDRLGGGLLVVNDQLGVNTTSEVNFAINYRLKFLHSKLSFGMQGGLVRYRYDYLKLNTEMVDPAIVQMRENYSSPNLGAGIFYKARQYYVGISVPRFFDVAINDGVATSTRYRRHLYVSGGYVFERFQGMKFKPSFLLRAVNREVLSLDLNMQVLLLEVLWTGIVFRNLDSIGLNSQIEIAEKLRAGYLFELPLGRLGSNSFGTHEFMVSMDVDIFKNQVAFRRHF